jgi:hypothetical protein
MWPMLSGANETSPRTELFVTGDLLIQVSDSGAVHHLFMHPPSAADPEACQQRSLTTAR